MVDSIFIIRPARKQDARRIAEFYRLSSDGVADYIWTRLAQPGEDLLDVGRRRYERDNTPFSYQNCTVLEVSGRLIGMLAAFPLAVDPDYVESDPVLAPYSRLEQDSSYYIASLAIDPAYRRRGLASELMQEAEVACQRQGLSSLSLIVFEQNRPALRFYQALGFQEVRREAVVPHPLLHYEGAALLLVKTLPTDSH